MINIIVACDRNNLIGHNGKLPWIIPEDWKYFLNTTKDGVLIMGRKCYFDFEEYAREREVIGLSQNPDFDFPYARKAHSLEESLSIAKKIGKEIWICGGQRIYEEALPLADRLYLTEINAEFKGDVYLPDWTKHFTKEISKRVLNTDRFKLTFRVFGK